MVIHSRVTLQTPYGAMSLPGSAVLVVWRGRFAPLNPGTKAMLVTTMLPKPTSTGVWTRRQWAAVTTTL
ncbi:hypothetical protein ACFYXM_34340 [Streptomyces sp. NPDC002476]|uniref:hypothetical protein n=1 Tax=Streptomyces sp. NPDC002476 TaxID=3364648 RepID=UPI00368DCFB8